MKTYITCIFIVLLTAISCKEEAVPKPDNLLSKEKMAAILYDVTLINSIKGVNKKKLEESHMHLDTYLYEKHEIDSVQFVKSNNYYAAYPLKYNEIYGLVQARLMDKRKNIEVELKAEQERRDSLRKAEKAKRNKKIDTAARKKLLKPIKKK